MAIRWDKELRKEIRREIDKVNKKFARARKMGFTKVPENIGMRKLKAQFGSKYASRRELRRQLAQYQKTSIEDLSNMVKLQKGGSVSEAVRKMTEQRRLRLFRRVRRDINDMMKLKSRASRDILPFANDEISRLKNIESKLAEGSLVSESRIRMINEMYVGTYSSSKKESFENALVSNMNSQLDKLQLSSDPAQDAKMKSTIKNYIGNTKIDQLISMNKNDDDFGEINDRYKKNEAYNAEDDDALVASYKNIYDKIKSGTYDSLYGE